MAGPVEVQGVEAEGVVARSCDPAMEKKQPRK